MSRRRLFPSAIVVLVIALTCAGASAEQEADTWQRSRSLEPLYERIGADLEQGKPLIIAGYYGMWHTRSDQPDRNLHWGVYYGHKTMMMRAAKDKHITKNYRHADWKLVHRDKQSSDPLRVLVFHQKVSPNARWKELGVQQAFDVYLVMQAWQSQEGAALAMTKNLRQDSAREVRIDDKTTIDLAEAQAVGYFGHNFFYDYADFEWDGLDGIEGEVERPTGVFAVGCKTGTVPGFGKLLTRNAFAVLYSRSLMATEGYSTLALADGLIRALDSTEMVGLADRTYRYFQKLAKPDRRVGRPFVSHGYRLFE
jgi:hypothetical protein